MKRELFLHAVLAVGGGLPGRGPRPGDGGWCGGAACRGGRGRGRRGDHLAGLNGTDAARERSPAAMIARHLAAGGKWQKKQKFRPSNRVFPLFPAHVCSKVKDFFVIIMFS